MHEIPLNLRATFPLKHHHAEFDCLKLRDTHALRTQLLGEMLELDAQRAHLEMGASTIDFSMVQTYKEMIQSRRVLLDQVSAAIIN
ncbi:MAG: hypothetical protein HRU20_05145 [Pseudomonadales bacterium]|nr:hypothetical protein [Pseudomonadales bacterium]